MRVSSLPGFLQTLRAGISTAPLDLGRGAHCTGSVEKSSWVPWALGCLCLIPLHNILTAVVFVVLLAETSDGEQRRGTSDTNSLQLNTTHFPPYSLYAPPPSDFSLASPPMGVRLRQPTSSSLIPLCSPLSDDSREMLNFSHSVK